jgi:glycosyltransferase A (GT-A) superfamily protein (DUF2064 family)
VLAPAIALFLDAPRPGVLPRIAADVGARHARRLYRVLAARALAAAAETGWRVTVWYAPAEAAAEMRRWLGEDVELRAQASGDPGQRLAVAARSVELGRTWLAVAPDGVPAGFTPDHLREADAALAYERLVIGPTAGGGVYLVGGPAPLPEVWRGLPWGTPALLDALRGRLASLGHAWREIAPLHGTDTAAEARAAGLLT